MSAATNNGNHNQNGSKITFFHRVKVLAQTIIRRPKNDEEKLQAQRVEKLMAREIKAQEERGQTA